MWDWATQSLFIRFAKAEFKVIRYAIIPPRHRSVPGASEFFITRDAAQMAWAFVILALLEALGLHLLLAGIGHPSVWAILILGDVFILYAIGFVRSLPRIPAVTVMQDGTVVIQAGVLFRMAVATRDITMSQTAFQEAQKRRVFRGALLSNPNCVLLFDRPQKGMLFSLFPIQRDAITLKIDNPDRLQECIKQPSI